MSRPAAAIPQCWSRDRPIGSRARGILPETLDDHVSSDIAARSELRHRPGHVLDIMPTLLEVASAMYPETIRGKAPAALEGRSLVPAFANKDLARDAPYWEHEGNRAIRKGDWKAVAKNRGEWELYNLKSDRTELKDHSAKDPERTKELALAWKAWPDLCGVWDWGELPLTARSDRKRSESAWHGR